MKPSISIAALIASCGLAWTGGALREAVVRAQGGTALYDWAVDGGDNQRTGWNREEKVLSKDNIKDMKLLWKLSTANQVRALHSLMPVIALTSRGEQSP